MNTDVKIAVQRAKLKLYRKPLMQSNASIMKSQVHNVSRLTVCYLAGIFFIMKSTAKVIADIININISKIET